MGIVFLASGARILPLFIEELIMFFRRKPDVMIVLAIIVVMGVVVSNITLGQAHPNEVAQNFLIR